jgi:5-oxopent-3-ene-1,2,5-tricarboxylate decarboxylase / 2-hydroxyhepta-2,4-diene-1,7-dioate isomerase
VFLARIRIANEIVVAARVTPGTLVRLDSLVPGGTDDPLALLALYGTDGLAAQADDLVARGDGLVDEEDVRFEGPVARCTKLVCVALNYPAHAKEGEFEVPSAPIIFFKPSTAIVGHNQTVIRPSRSVRLDYEVELGVVIGKRVRDLTPERWQEAVAGYTVLNDITARDLQLEAIEANVPWDRSKGFDTFAPLGPYLVTPDEVPNPHELDLEIRIGDRVLQSSNTRNMIFDIPQLLADISADMTLEPGDVIGTGTPDGIGPVEHGDVMEATVEHLGTLRSPVVCATTGARLVPA